MSSYSAFRNRVLSKYSAFTASHVASLGLNPLETWLAPPDWVEKFVFFMGVFDQNSIRGRSLKVFKMGHRHPTLLHIPSPSSQPHSQPCSLSPSMQPQPLLPAQAPRPSSQPQYAAPAPAHSPCYLRQAPAPS